MIPVSVETLILGSSPDRSVVVLRPFMETGPAPKVIPIYIGEAEAMAINSALINKGTGRPQTHDLMLDIIDALAGKIERVVIDRVDGMSFYSKLVMEQDGDRFEIDSRPSDSIALAIRDDIPIFVESPVFVAASVNFNSRRNQIGKKEMEEFHEFVERLNPDDFANPGQESTETGEKSDTE